MACFIFGSRSNKPGIVPEPKKSAVEPEKQERGMTLEQMADKLAEVRGYRLHFSTINREVRLITDEYKKRNDDLLDRHRQRQLMRLDAQEQEAWRAWEKSKEDAITKQGERISGQAGQNGAAAAREKSLVKQSGRVGNAEFLRVMLSIAERRCKLLGLDAPAKNVLMNPDGSAIQPATPAAVLILPEEQVHRLTNDDAQRLSRDCARMLAERRNGNGNGNGHSPAPHKSSNGNGHAGNEPGNGNGHGLAVGYEADASDCDVVSSIASIVGLNMRSPSTSLESSNSVILQPR